MDTTWLGDRSKRFRGTVRASGAAIRTKIGYKNAFQTELALTVSPSASGSTVTYTTGMSAWVVAFLAVWGAVPVAMVSALLVGSVTGQMEAWPALLGPGAFVAFGGGLVTAGRLLAAGERAQLLHLVQETLEVPHRS